MQIEIFPMRRDVFERRFPVVGKGRFRRSAMLDTEFALTEGLCACPAMGLAPGGRMRQEIYEDPFSIHDWDTERGSRCFLHLVNSAAWHAITGERPPTQPPTAKQYTQAGYPWFDYYDKELKALGGSGILANVKSVLQMGKQKHAQPLPGNESVSVSNLVNLRSGLQPHQVRESDFS
jgi:hypothetical protein